MTTSYGADAASWDHFATKLGLFRDLLPVVSNPTAKISAQSSMKALGKTPSVFNKAREVVGLSGWTTRVSTPEDIAKWSAEPDYGLCLQTRTVRALDIDIADATEARAVVEAIRAALPGVVFPMRSRNNSAKCLLVFKLEGDLSKRVLRTSKGMVELLATGQHFVACGTHPSGARYEWQGGLPASVPTLILGELEGLWDALGFEFATEEPTTARAPSKKKKLAAVGRAIACEIVEEQTIADLRSALLSMTADDRDRWQRLGHGLKTLGDAGRELWLEWSATSEKHDPCADAATWDGFKPNRTSWRAVFAAAQLEGWVNPMSSGRGRGADDFSDLSFLPAAGDTPVVDQDSAVISDEAEEEQTANFPEPFRGAMAAVVNAALKSATKPQPELCTLSALIGMASACHGLYSLPSGMRLNLYGLGVAGTGAGKDSPRQIPVKIALAADALIIGKPASGQGMEDILVDIKGTLLEADEIAHLFAMVNDPRAPSHLVEIAAQMLRLFSSSNAPYRTRVRAAQRGITAARTVLYPCMNIWGSSTPLKLGEALTIKNVEDGLIGRFLFCFGRENVLPRRVGARLELPAEVATTASKIGGANIF